jgi:hypothetical protein
MEVCGQLHTPTALPLGKRVPGTHWIGGWVGCRTRLDEVAKRKKILAAYVYILLELANMY